MRRLGFTMIELIFVIVVMGIIGKFGVEFLAQAYKGFIFSNVNHNLQANGEVAVESIASRLQYRIKDSIIARKTSDDSFLALGSASGTDYNILEWVSTDIDGFRGESLPHWSGIIDLDDSNSTSLDSPETNTSAIHALVDILSNSGSGMNNTAIYFIGSDSDINNYGWTIGGAAFTDQTNVMHPVSSGTTIEQLVPTVGNFNGVDVYEYYQLAWTAYAVGIDDYDTTDNNGTLSLWYDYQPWEGENYKTHGKKVTLMKNVSTFQFKSIGSIVKIQVCVNSDLVEDYSLCKEKTIF
ncbi:prepilin-type N-terminal cleavage/methylation domain-containing protein [Sulfurimonas sp.]|nr:prepilin-type N-terminal cleavage/methylation domain-containing protein [Sulfurimonas sp.]